MADSAGRILLVEDEKNIADILIDYLRQSGFEVSHVNNGVDVVPAIKKTPPHLEVCREIRTFSMVPVIMVTARVDEIDRLLGLELGADDYICKPFSPREVVARVKAMLRRLRVASPAEQKPRLLEIDEAQNRVTANGQRLELTPTEFRLLKLMAANPGRVYSRGILLDLCYQQEQQIYDRVIDSHIKNLRKKLSKALNGQDAIHSVYGVGYRFELE